MPLPVNVMPTYTLQVPSTKKPFKYHQFLVRDEKALLIAQEAGDPTVMIDTIRSVIASCALDPIDTALMPSFDTEWIFIKMRAISVGELVSLKFACDMDHGPECEKAAVMVNLNDVRVVETPGHSNRVPLFEDVGVVMRYPTFETFKQLESIPGDSLDQIFDVTVSCMDYIYTATEVFYAKDQTKAELLAFMNGLTSEQFLRIQNFFETAPKVRLDIHYTCPVCKKAHDKHLDGMQSFF